MCLLGPLPNYISPHTSTSSSEQKPSSLGAMKTVVCSVSCWGSVEADGKMSNDGIYDWAQ